MPKKKVLGMSIDYQDIVNFNVKLLVSYRTKSNEVVKREAVVPIQTTDKQTAIRLAIEKTKRQLEEFPYIKEIITLEAKGRKKREV